MKRILAPVALLAALAAGLALALDGGALAPLLVVYLLWDGAAESVYSLSSAHASDRADKDDMLALSSSLLFAWSLSGFAVPGAVTLLSAVYGTGTFIYVSFAIALAYALFVLWRTLQRAAPEAAPGGFAPMTAQAPLPVELAFTPEEGQAGP